MIFTKNSLDIEIKKLMVSYPDLVIQSSSPQMVVLHGPIKIHRCIDNFTLHNTYTLNICIPIESDELPYIIDINHVIEPNYEHYYNSGKLCLETDTAIRLRFIDGFNLVEWMDEFVETYFLSYEYYKLYGEYPFGERQHGILGVIETYQELLHSSTPHETIVFMKYILSTRYRGHDNCPCNSGFRLRNCHGIYFSPFYSNDIKYNILENDFKNLKEELNEFYRKYKK